MKFKRTLVAVVTSVFLCMSLMIPVFADGEGNNNMNDNDSNQGSSGNYGQNTWKSDWQYDSTVYGYKVQFMINRNGLLEKESSATSNGNEITATVVSFSGVDTSQTSINKISPVTEQRKLVAAGFDSNRDLFLGYDYSTNKIELANIMNGAYVKTIDAATSSVSTPFSSSMFILEGAGDIAKSIGDPWSGVGDKLDAEFRKETTPDGSGTLSALVVDALAQGLQTASSSSTGTALDNRFTLACKIYDMLSQDMKDKVGSKPKSVSSPDAATFVSRMLPLSDDCIVSWGFIVEPLFKCYPSDKTSTRLPDCYSDFMGSAAEWAFLHGATLGFAQDKKDTYASMPENTQEQQLAKLDFKNKWNYEITGTNPSTYGEFVGCWGVSTDVAPNSVFTEKGWFEIPAALHPHGVYDPYEVTKGGAGIGIYTHKSSTNYAQATATPAPTPSPTPLPQTQNPVIKEDHLSQALTVNGLIFHLLVSLN